MQNYIWIEPIRVKKSNLIKTLSSPKIANIYLYSSLNSKVVFTSIPMNPETMTLFDRMDGDRILPEALQKFNDKVIKDPLLIPFFENLDKEAVVEHQKLALMVRSI